MKRVKGGQKCGELGIMVKWDCCERRFNWAFLMCNDNLALLGGGKRARP